MGFFDRAERERAIDRRMYEMEKAARERQEAAVRQSEADVSAVQQAEQKVAEQPEAPPAPIAATPLEDVPYEDSYIKAPEDEASEAAATAATAGKKKPPAPDRFRNLAGAEAILKYATGKGTGMDVAKGVGESVLAAAEDVGQAGVAALEAGTSEKGQQVLTSIRRLDLGPIGTLLRTYDYAKARAKDIGGAAEAVGGAIREHRKGKAEEAYGGPAQAAEAAEASEEAEKGTASAYAYSHDDGTPIGALSQKSESGEDGKPLKLSSTGKGGIDAISFGRGDPGGKSYGRHQFMTRMIKDKNGNLTRTGRYDPADSTMASFLQSKEAKPFSKEILASITDANGKVNWDLLGSDKFDAAWTKVTTGDSRDAWGAAQSNYLGRTHLKPNLDYLNKKYEGNDDVALLLTNKGFLEAIYSGGIQYGARGARKHLIMPALLQAEKDNKLGDVAHVIELLYARRKRTGYPRLSEKKQVLEMAKS